MHSSFVTNGFLASLISSVAAVNIVGFPVKGCGNKPTRSCNNIKPKECCAFPLGGLVTQSVKYSAIPECTVGVWYYRKDNKDCGGTARDTKGGSSSTFNVCLSGGSAGATGGGAAYFDICHGKRTSSPIGNVADLARQTEGKCETVQYATLYSWPQDEPGVYVLRPTKDQFDQMNSLPQVTSEQEQLLILKEFNATYYAEENLVPEFEGLTL